MGPVVENCQWDQAFLAEYLPGEHVGRAVSTAILGFGVTDFYFFLTQ